MAETNLIHLHRSPQPALATEVRRLLISDSTPVLVVSETRIAFGNPAASALLGGSLINVDVAELCEPAVFAEFKNFLEIVETSRVPVSGLLTFAKPLGSPPITSIKCEGSLLRPAGSSGAAFITLRLRPWRKSVCARALQDNTIRKHEEEIRRRRTAESGLRDALASFVGVFDNAAVGMAIIDLDGRFNRVNDQFCRIVGYSPAEVTKMTFPDLTHPDDLQADLEAVAKLQAGESNSFQLLKRYICKNNDIAWVRITVSLAQHTVSGQKFYIGIIEDYEDRRAAEETRDLLVGELNHRVKNSLAMVQGIVQQTLVTTPEPKAFAEVLQPRLTSLSTAHNLLSQHDWVSLMFGELLAATVDGPFAAFADRIDHTGADVRLSSQETVMFTLVLHELLTNAVKHGALAVESGRIKIVTQFDPYGRETAFVMNWEEFGGPPVVTSQKRGFGRFVLEEGASHSLGGTTKIEYAKQGFRYSLACPLRLLRKAAQGAVGQ